MTMALIQQESTACSEQRKSFCSCSKFKLIAEFKIFVEAKMHSGGILQCEYNLNEEHDNDIMGPVFSHARTNLPINLRRAQVDAILL